MLTFPAPLDRRAARAAASKQRIATAAESIVLADGKASLTTSALAELADVSERTVFNHFKKLDDALIYRLASYLEPCIAEPAFPTDLEVAELPQAIVEHFHASLDAPLVQESLLKFLALAAAMNTEEFDLIAKEIMLTMGTISDRFCAGVDSAYPQLTPQQSITNGLFTFNLMSGILFGFLRFAQECSEDFLSQQVTVADLTPQDFLPFMRQNIDQVAGGTPTYTAS